MQASRQPYQEDIGQEDESFYAGQSGGGFQVPNQSDLHMFILNPAQELERIEHKLRGEVMDSEKSTSAKTIWKIPLDKKGKSLTEPVMNEQGINEIMTMLDSWINKNNILSHLDEALIRKHSIGILTQLIIVIAQNYHAWDIREGKLEYIYSLVEVPITVGVLRRAYQGRALSAIMKSIFRQEVVQGGEPKQKDNMGKRIMAKMGLY